MTGHYTTRNRPARAAGFTLMEILIALSIFGVGLAMAASLFPASIGEHEKAVEYTVGTLMCNNGITLAKAQLTHPPKLTDPPPDASTLKGTMLNGRIKYPSISTETNPFYQYKVTVTKVPAGPTTPENTYDVKVQAFKGGDEASQPFTEVTIRTPLNVRASP